MILNRIEKLRTKILENNIDLMLILNPKNIFYFTSYFPHATAFLFVNGDKKELIVPSLEYDDARTKADKLEVVQMESNKKLLEILTDYLIKQDKFNIGIEEDYITFIYTEHIKSKLKDLKLKPANKLISELRTEKSKKEISLLQKAASITDAAMKVALDSIEIGIMESEIAANLEYEMKKKGAQGPAFDTIVASGPNSALPHATISKRKIRKNEIILVDIGACYEGYCNDMTRTVFLGTPSEKDKKFYDTIIKAKKAGEGSYEFGMLGKKLDELPRNIIEKDLHCEFIHSLGHGVGIEVHESPSIGPTSEEMLTTGNVFTIEPAVYEFDHGGVRLEDTYYVSQNKKLISLNKFPFQFEI
ncbi:MAG: aminopeptidase P family protein [Candidatus Lokiarchaeota archaeon]|nr:aminopeptidase P family protein [Candidatus Lokiarchaeota archaeon]